MVVGDAKLIALELLRGDNTNALITPLLLREAVHQVARHCEPERLKTIVDTDVFREIYTEDGEVSMYLRRAVLSVTDDEQLDIDEELSMAVVHFLCAYFSNKNKDIHTAKAREIISTFKTNKPY